MVSDDDNYGLRCPGRNSSQSFGPGRLVSADHGGFSSMSLSSSVFLAWEKSAKRLLSGERYPSRFVIHRFSPCILWDHLFFFVLGILLCSLCASRECSCGRATALCSSLACAYMYDGGTGKRAVLSRWARIWAHGLLDSAVLSSDVLFPRILLHLHLWLFEHCQPGALQSSWCELTTCEGKYFRIGLSLSISGGVNMGLCILMAHLLEHAEGSYHSP